MDTRQYEYILAIADERYISRAAEKLCISQPTLSQFLSKLEAELGVDLFLHSRNGFTPTPEGEIYIDGARRILKINAEIRAKISPFADRKKNRLVVGLTAGRSAQLFSEFFPIFNKYSPEIEIQIIEAHTQNIDELAKSGYLDFALVTSDYDDDQLEFEPFVREEIVFVVNKRHPRAAVLSERKPDGGSGGLDLSLFKDDKFVLSKKGYRLRTLIDAHLKKIGFQPIVLLETTENALTSNMIHNELAVGFLPAAYAGLYPDLVAFSLEPKLTWDFGAAYRKGSRVTPPMRLFIDLVREFLLSKKNDRITS